MRDLVARLAPGVAGVDAVSLLQNPEGERVDLAGGPRPGAEGLEEVRRRLPDEVLAEDAAGRVAGAEEENLERLNTAFNQAPPSRRPAPAAKDLTHSRISSRTRRKTAIVSSGSAAPGAGGSSKLR